MSLKDMFKPTDEAPDWIGHTAAERVSNCIMHLLLYEAITEKEAVEINKRMESWVWSDQQSLDTS